jgi:hypothetical protein
MTDWPSKITAGFVAVIVVLAFGFTAAAPPARAYIPCGSSGCSTSWDCPRPYGNCNGSGICVCPPGDEPPAPVAPPPGEDETPDDPDDPGGYDESDTCNPACSGQAEFTRLDGSTFLGDQKCCPGPGAGWCQYVDWTCSGSCTEWSHDTRSCSDGSLSDSGWVSGDCASQMSRAVGSAEADLRRLRLESPTLVGKC